MALLVEKACVGITYLLCISCVTFEEISFQEQAKKIREKNIYIKLSDLLSNSGVTITQLVIKKSPKSIFKRAFNRTLYIKRSN